MRGFLVAAIVASAPLVWCEVGRAQILAERPISISGSRSGAPAESVQILVSFDDLQVWTENPVLFDSVTWTPADVGRIVSIGSFLDDPDFPAARDTLINGLDGLVSVQVSIQPGGGGPGMATNASNLFAGSLHGAVDFVGSQIDAIALRLDALTLDDPSEGSVSVEFTLLVISTGVGSETSVEFWQCKNDLEDAQYENHLCTEMNRDLYAWYVIMENQWTNCEIALSTMQFEISQLEAQLNQAEGAANEAEAGLRLAQVERANAEAALAAAIADADQDGVRDSGDACPSTEPAAAVDGVGCSKAQFCSPIDATSGPGRATCNRSDWRNDEPLEDRPDDCKATAGLCEAVSS
jgi:hypothetical protein